MLYVDEVSVKARTGKSKPFVQMVADEKPSKRREAKRAATLAARRSLTNVRQRKSRKRVCKEVKESQKDQRRQEVRGHEEEKRKEGCGLLEEACAKKDRKTKRSRAKHRAKKVQRKMKRRITRTKRRLQGPMQPCSQF